MTGTRPQMDYIPSVLNPADAPSRLVAQLEWRIARTTFNKIQRKYSPHSSSLEHMEDYLQLPPFELNTESNTKGKKRKGNNNVDSTPLEICNMVSGSSGDGNTATNTDTIIKSTTRKQKRKFGSEQKQKLDAISMENKRIRLSQQGLDSSAIHFMLNKNHQKRKQKNYSSIQNRFISWCDTRNVLMNNINASTIINFLNEGKEKGKWTTGTVYGYRTAILDLLDNAEQLWGKNEDMKIINLTSKLCFLLGFCGFMRPSDIERIDESRTTIEEKFVRFIIIIYVRKIRNHSEHVGSEWISNSIKSVIKLLKIPKGQKTPKARALGSTKAIRAGANLNDILTQGFWSSQSIFDTFYNLEHRANENLTELILVNQDSEATLSVSQSEVQ
ncbi:hypothetical protein BB558_003131 [Smittium angustum]|uniref:Core-binding (CB) domain-containing protein n=1 Tax=Smittium angustum TaxID=133377 RepID=A0A2U1J6V9_SMIAN|nr:hypothetical protein BB558_003131 [Smittium angustum]